MAADVSSVAQGYQAHVSVIPLTFPWTHRLLPQLQTSHLHSRQEVGERVVSPSHICYIFLLINLFVSLFIYLFRLCWVFVAARGLSLVAASRGYSSLRCMGFSLRWLLLLWSTGSRHAGFSSCGTQAQ